MSSQTLTPLLVTRESTPRTHKIFMDYPIEVTECWANITAGKAMTDGVMSTVGESLVPSLFKFIRQAFVDDELVAEDEHTPSGLKTLRGELCSSELPKAEKLEVTARKAKHISALAQRHSSMGTIKGGHITTDKIPLSVAQEALDMVRTATKMMLSAKDSERQAGDNCYVRMSVLFQLDKH